MKKSIPLILAAATAGILFTVVTDVAVYELPSIYKQPLTSFILPTLNLSAANQITFTLADLGPDIENMLRQKSNGLNPAVIDKVLRTLACSKVHRVEHNHILTIIDYSLPSSEKRLWVFDLNARKLLFHTYVSHGLKSGTLLSNYFSNKYNSRASSIGVYKTDKAYYGREGLSLRLAGIDRSFNDNASNRSVVMHGGWYVEENFIKRYGRAGRSWGCPALPLALYQDIINTIKDNSLFVVYYPSERWFATSKFLTCNEHRTSHPMQLEAEGKPNLDEDKYREYVLFANTSHKNSKLEESAPILAVSADRYERLFQAKPPLSRMLRRQVNHAEYIALSTSEFKQLIESKTAMDDIYFILPTIKDVRGYHETVMKVVNLGKIKDVSTNTSTYVIHFESNSAISLISTNRFIRWLGL
jgi:hypothetical protein